MHILTPKPVFGVSFYFYDMLGMGESVAFWILLFS
jgi:hypothetical protein